MRRYFIRLLILLVLAAAVGWWAWLQGRKPATTGPAPSPAPQVQTQEVPAEDAVAAPEGADWASLEPFQDKLSRKDFVAQMDGVFSATGGWRKWFEVHDQEVKIFTEPDRSKSFVLRFAKDDTEATAPSHRGWRSAEEMPPAAAERPLEGVKIAIDPGHIGGTWGKMEERWFQMPGGTPVLEGDMTLEVAKLLKPRLEEFGAVVTLVRDKAEPVTAIRPGMLHAQAAASPTPGEDIRMTAERLFYRTAEIHARARLVNETIQPDLVLCLHFDATDWVNPKEPAQAATSHFHMIVNGAYTDDEIALPEQRLEMVSKIAEGIHAEERALAFTAAEVFVEKTGLPAHRYNTTAHTARNVGGNPYVWARNLLANRLYERPVLFYEPYVMNCQEDYERIQAGDYEGEQEVGGRMRLSIFHEYADAVAEGLARYYRQHRSTR